MSTVPVTNLRLHAMVRRKKGQVRKKKLAAEDRVVGREDKKELGDR